MCQRPCPGWSHHIPLLLTSKGSGVDATYFIRGTNAIESTFATVKLRQRVTKGAGSRTAGLTMAFKLLTMAERRWRRLNAPHLVAQVRAGVRFRDGLRIERADITTEIQTAA